MADEVVIVVRAEDSFSGVLGNFGNILTGIKSAIDLAGDALRTFAGFAMEGLDAIASYERLSASLQSLVASQLLMNGAATDMASAMDVAGIKAEQLLGWVQELAINSPFTQEGVANAFRLAMAYGFSADEAQRLTEAMINFAAGTGASEQVMSQIALALGQIEAKGKLAGQEVLQLVNAGLPVTQILAEAFGVTTAEIEKMREDGLIPAHEAIEAITVYLETNFAGAAQNQALTWAGLLGTFEDLKQMGLREFFGGLFEALQPFAVAFAGWVQSEGLDRLREMGQTLGELTSNFMEIAQIVGAFVTGDMDALLDIFVRIGAEGIPGMRELSDMLVGLEEVNLSTIVDILRELTGIDFSSMSSMGEALIQSVMSVDWEQMSDNIAEGISSIDWGRVGNVIAEGLGYAVMAASVIIEQIDWSDLLNAILNGFADLMAGLFGFVDWEDMIASAEVGFRYVGQSIVDGLRSGLLAAWANFTNLPTMLFNNFITSIKALLGISSPSTIFAAIGRDIVLGLIGGFTAYWENLIDIATTSLDNFLNLFGIDLSFGGQSASGLGTAGGGTSGGGTGTGGTSGEVHNYYYGPVYFMGAGEPGAYYDCPSPNPFMTAGSQTIMPNGVH